MFSDFYDAPRVPSHLIRFFCTVQDVRVDTALNHFLWSRGCRNVPRKVRIRVSRTQNEEEGAKEKFYSTVHLLEVGSFAELHTEKK